MGVKRFNAFSPLFKNGGIKAFIDSGKGPITISVRSTWEKFNIIKATTNGGEERIDLIFAPRTLEGEEMEERGV